MAPDIGKVLVDETDTKEKLKILYTYIIVTMQANRKTVITELC